VDGTGDAEDEIRMLQDGWRLLGHDVQAELVARGWKVSDLEVGDDEPLEFHWPPTAPAGYGGRTEPVNEAARRRPLMHRPRRTPWTRPTRITRTPSGWRVDYGEAIAQEPDPSQVHQDDRSLLADLDRIEWWPMPIEKAHRIRMRRVLETTVADANDDHHRAAFPTEPYASRLAELREHVAIEDARRLGLSDVGQPSSPRPRGDLRAKMRLVDADAWASAVRTAKAGGEGLQAEGPGN